MEKKISHNWGDWYKSKFYAVPVRVCRRCGEMVFELNDHKSAKESVSLQMVNGAVQEVMQATDVDGVRKQITRLSTVLFSPVTEKYFNFVVDQLAPTAEAKDVYRNLAGVIDRCRREGVDNVFGQTSSATAPVTSGISTNAPAPPKPEANLDQRLIGHWRHTEILGFERSCYRCKEKESRVEHQWGTWLYRRKEACDQGIQCARCGTWAKDSRVEHDWGEWKYEERYRAPLHTCVRCSTVASYFPDQPVEPVASERSDSALTRVQELLSNDDAVADLLKRAEAGSTSGPTPGRRPELHKEDDSDWQDGLKILRRIYDEQVQSGVISPERRPLFNSILSELEAVTRNPDSSLAEKQIKARRIQDAMLRLREALLDPSRGTAVKKLATGTRLALIAKLHDELYRYVYTEVAGGNLAGEEGQAGVALLGELRDTREALTNPCRRTATRSDWNSKRCGS